MHYYTFSCIDVMYMTLCTALTAACIQYLPPDVFNITIHASLYMLVNMYPLTHMHGCTCIAYE